MGERRNREMRKGKEGKNGAGKQSRLGFQLLQGLAGAEPTAL